MASEREKYLEDVLAQFLRPMKGVPFEVVVKSICNQSVEKFDIRASGSAVFLKKLSEAMTDACKTVQARPIERYRPNEVGNDMEPFVAQALTVLGLATGPARTRAGKGKATGYPDLRIETDGLPVYLEVKTYAAANHATTQRSFYLSPAEDHKVADDAHHLLVGFEIEDRGANGRKDDRGRELRDYVPVAFVVVDLYGMECDMKFEFNSDNKRLYDEGRLLAEGRVQ